jgi:hypothetical protein
MAITTSNLTFEPKSFSKGHIKFQIVNIVAATGATAGTCTADRLKEIYHIIIPGLKSHTAAPTFATNVATLAFTVPAETAASQEKDEVTITAVAGLGAAGNSITLAYTAGATAGAEVVSVTGNAISVQIETGVSTVTQVRTAINADAAAAALVTATGTSGNTVATAAATACTGGVNGGFRGPCICIGR